MRSSLVWMVLVLSVAACKSEAEKLCFDGTMQDEHRVSACGEVCQGGNERGCAIQSEVALQRCMKDRDAETCRWMCHYGRTGQDLYCKEYEAITGKPAE